MTVSQFQLIGLDGAALAALDTDGLIAAFEPTAGADTTITGSLLDPFSTGTGEVDWARSVTATLVDANASITQVKVYLTGTDVSGGTQQETLTLSAAGTVESNRAFASLTAVVYHVDGTVTGGLDTLEVGWADKLGLPTTVSALTDIRTKRVDTTIDSGTIDLTYQTWEPTAGNIPNASKRFYIEVFT
jgi:hypothetical protein